MTKGGRIEERENRRHFMAGVGIEKQKHGGCLKTKDLDVLLSLPPELGELGDERGELGDE